MPGFELSDISTKYRQESTENLTPKSDKMYVSTAKAVIFVLLAVVLAVGVGIIVHFAGPGKTIECHCNYPSVDDSGTSAAIEQCKDWATDGNDEICSACPSAATTTHAPTTATVPEVTTTAPSKVTDVRLPTALEPLLYTVELQPHMYEGEPETFYFNGSVTIKLRCKTNANNITLHSNLLTITGEINVYAENDMINNLYKSHSFDHERQFLVVMTTQPLQANKNYTVEITHFRGPLNPDLAGLYLSTYTRGNKKIHIATTQMQPTDARKTFPCMDEPAIKAEFDVTLVRKSNMISISNSPIIQNETRGDGWVADKFQTTAKMSTYLLAFIICDFDYIVNTTKNNVTYRAYARPEAIDQAKYSLEIGVPILDYFEEYFGIPYPLPKQDMIALPDFAAGAMENWGLITYRETAMLYEPGVSSEGNKQRVAIVVSHELAHQWFGNLVTPSWWDDLWLNEGFASYVEYMGVDHYHPDWKMFDQFVVIDLQSVFDIDGLISSHPVYVPVAHPDEINEIFDRISYAKGASIIRMMRFFMGDTVFQKGLTRYLKKLAYDAAFHDDLWNALADEAREQNHNFTNVKDIMDTWVLQMNYPVVTIKHDQAGRITVDQHRYLKDPNATDPKKYTSEFNYTWYIPFTYTTSKTPSFNVTSNDVVFLNRNTEPVTITDVDIPAPGGTKWIIGNPKQYGYYRVNYETENWNALITQLRSNHMIIDPINRAQIINDAWSLAASGELDMKIALRTTEYLQNEREYVPWDAARTQLSFVGSMLVRNKLFGSFQKFMQNKTIEVFRDLTMNNTGATHLESYMRSTISSLACSYGIDECVNSAVALYKQWMDNNGTNPIDPGLKSTVYCIAVSAGGVEEWEFALNQYRTSNLAAEKQRLLSAMACTQHSWILSRYLEMAINPDEIRYQDSTTVIRYISGNTIGRSLAWDFFRENWDRLFEIYGESAFSFSNLVSDITSTFSTQFQYDQLKSFMDSLDNLGSTVRAFEQALEKTQSNINWMKANVPVIESWLHEQGF